MSISLPPPPSVSPPAPSHRLLPDRAAQHQLDWTCAGGRGRRAAGFNFHAHYCAQLCHYECESAEEAGGIIKQERQKKDFCFKAPALPPPPARMSCVSPRWSPHARQESIFATRNCEAVGLTPTEPRPLSLSRLEMDLWAVYLLQLTSFGKRSALCCFICPVTAVHTIRFSDLTGLIWAATSAVRPLMSDSMLFTCGCVFFHETCAHRSGC